MICLIKTYYYVWEDGTISFVAANSKMDAANILDEIGDAKKERLKEFEGNLFFTIKPHKDVLEMKHEDDDYPPIDYTIEEIPEEIRGIFFDVCCKDGDKRKEWDAVVKEEKDGKN